MWGEKQRLWQIEYRKKNREKVRAWSRTPEARKKAAARQKIRRNKNPEKFNRELNRRWHSTRTEWFNKNGPCVKCGSWERLELDHIDTKTKRSHTIWADRIEKREEELKKCQVLCFFCHRIKTNIERGWNAHGYSMYRNFGCRCKKCLTGFQKWKKRNKDS